MSKTLLKEKANKSHGEIMVVGVGNRLLGDESIGLHIIDNLFQIPMPPYVNIIDCGCDLFTLCSYLNKPRKIIIVDAIRAGGKPGEIYKFDYAELGTAQAKMHSAHQIGTTDALGLLKQLYPALDNCEIILIGIEPKAIELSSILSQEVRESMADAMGLVLEECSQVIGTHG